MHDPPPPLALLSLPFSVNRHAMAYRLLKEEFSSEQEMMDVRPKFWIDDDSSWSHRQVHQRQVSRQETG